MEASIATAVAEITDTSVRHFARVQQLCLNIIVTALEGLRVPGGEVEKKKIQEQLEKEANLKLQGILGLRNLD